MGYPNHRLHRIDTNNTRPSGTDLEFFFLGGVHILNLSLSTHSFPYIPGADDLCNTIFFLSLLKCTLVHSSIVWFLATSLKSLRKSKPDAQILGYVPANCTLTVQVCSYTETTVFGTRETEV